MNYYIYNDTTGIIRSVGFSIPAAVDRSQYITLSSYEEGYAAQRSSYESAVQDSKDTLLTALSSEGFTAVEGVVDPKSQRVDVTDASKPLVAYTPPAKVIDYALANRAERNQRLSESDWTQFADSPLTSTKKTEWATYRQDLRDLPEDLDDFDTAYVSDSDWPTKPS